MGKRTSQKGFFIKVDQERSMRDRRGSGPALLNVPAFMRAVKLSVQGGWQV